jgi:Do/DeqQ family serine protease
MRASCADLRNNRGYRESRSPPRIPPTATADISRQDFSEAQLQLMRNLWLIFAQAATIAVGALFVVTTLKPEWLGRSASGPQVVELRQATPAVLPARATSYSDAVRKAVPAVVSVLTSKEIKSQRHPFLEDPLFRHFFGDQLEEEPQRAASLGSGVIVSSKGYILTNHHVVEAADEIEVALVDGKKLKAKAVGSDPETDIAVLQVEGGPLPAISFGDADSLRVGDVVLAIGNPFTVGQTVTMGIVSALGRKIGLNTFENFIQTDAAINPGNSGGALIDTAGNLVGINTAIYSRSGGSLGIGFAIPASSAKQVMEQIIESGSVTRGWIGVEAQEITPEIADSFRLSSTNGVLIAGVLRGGPAEKAGLKPGDILVAIEGRSVKDPNSMLNLVAALVPGKPASIRLKRDNKDIEVQVAVGKRPVQQRKRR